MKQLTDEQLKNALESHRKYLFGEKGGERADFVSVDLGGANLYGANLRGANLYGADLGSTTFLGCSLRLIGACVEAVEWVDTQDHSDFAALYASARRDWRSWLTSTLGGVPSLERLEFVFDFITKGV